MKLKADRSTDESYFDFAALFIPIHSRPSQRRWFPFGLAHIVVPFILNCQLQLQRTVTHILSMRLLKINPCLPSSALAGSRKVTSTERNDPLPAGTGFLSTADDFEMQVNRDMPTVGHIVQEIQASRACAFCRNQTGDLDVYNEHVKQFQACHSFCTSSLSPDPHQLLTDSDFHRQRAIQPAYSLLVLDERTASYTLTLRGDATITYPHRLQPSTVALHLRRSTFPDPNTTVPDLCNISPTDSSLNEKQSTLTRKGRTR